MFKFFSLDSIFTFWTSQWLRFEANFKIICINFLKNCRFLTCIFTSALLYMHLHSYVEFKVLRQLFIASFFLPWSRLHLSPNCLVTLFWYINLNLSQEWEAAFIYLQQWNEKCKTFTLSGYPVAYPRGGGGESAAAPTFWGRFFFFSFSPRRSVWQADGTPTIPHNVNDAKNIQDFLPFFFCFSPRRSVWQADTDVTPY